MRLLPDTHLILWWEADDARLSETVRRLVRDEADAVHVSRASLWEIAIKRSLGCLQLDLEQFISTPGATSNPDSPSTIVSCLRAQLGMLYTDIGKGLPLVLQFLMYVTPVVFPMPTSGIAATIFAWNPLTPLILTARDWLTGFPADHLASFLLINAVVLVLVLLLVGVVFRLTMPMLIERMGS